MHHDVRQYMAHCSICQQTKYETYRPTGLRQRLLIPTATWEDLYLDFITGLPSSQGYTTILVVVDRYSKGTHLVALQPHYIAYKVVLLFIDMVYKHHSFPRSIVLSRDPLFISNFWHELFRLSGTKLLLSTTYHPQFDGQTEVLNHVLEKYLRAFIHDRL